MKLAESIPQGYSGYAGGFPLLRLPFGVNFYRLVKQAGQTYSEFALIVSDPVGMPAAGLVFYSNIDGSRNETAKST